MPQNLSNFQVQRNKAVGQSLERIATWAIRTGADLVKMLIDAIRYMIQMMMGKY